MQATQVLVEKVAGASGDRREVLEREIARLLSVESAESRDSGSPKVVMVVGVNGSGKTTTVGKLCRWFSQEGEKVLVAAADTYRDAASEQLSVWAGRAGVDIVASQQGQDAAAVAYDAIAGAQSRGIDTVLVDTAGRLHTRADLMAEAVKIKRVCGKVRSGAPDEVWLVLDATVGQNGLRQAQAFNEQLGLTGLIVAKLDGTARGGVLIPVVLELGIPIRFVGTGEGVEDLEPFAPEAYSRALFED
jgi:fused signal recognition particle receptor